MARPTNRSTVSILLVLAAALAVAFTGLRAQQAPPPFDVLITGARIVDGTGAPWFKATSLSPAIASSR